jgi:expansin
MGSPRVIGVLLSSLLATAACSGEKSPNPIENTAPIQPGATSTPSSLVAGTSTTPGVVTPTPTTTLPANVGSAAGTSAATGVTPPTGSGDPVPPVTSSSASVTGAANTSSEPPPPVVDPTLIDDFEDGDARITEVAGRMGQWTAYNDGTAGGSQTPQGAGTPSASGAQGSQFALHTVGSGFASWGAGVQLDFNNPGNGASSRLPFNATSYQGISFYIKGSGSVRFELPTLATTDSAAGGTCAAECLDTHGIALSLTPDWTLVTIPFSDLEQEGWGAEAAFDPASVLGLAFKVPGSAASPATFDFWVDDVKFTTSAVSTLPSAEPPPPMVSSSVPGQCGDLGGGYNGNGSVTYYYFAQGSSEVNCSYAITGQNPDRVAHIATGDGGTLFGAMNTTDYANSAVCGACVEVTRDGGRSVVITIVDQCPVATNPKCTKGHIDLSVAAFDQLGNRGNEGYLGTGNGGMAGSISWKYVACPTPENISFRLKEPDNEAWNQLLVQSHKYPIQSVSINGTPAARQPHNYWEPPDGDMGKAPYEVKVTDVNGGVVTSWIEHAAGDIDSGLQLSCQ